LGKALIGREAFPSAPLQAAQATAQCDTVAEQTIVEVGGCWDSR